MLHNKLKAQIEKLQAQERQTRLLAAHEKKNKSSLTALSATSQPILRSAARGEPLQMAKNISTTTTTAKNEKVSKPKLSITIDSSSKDRLSQLIDNLNLNPRKKFK